MTAGLALRVGRLGLLAGALTSCSTAPFEAPACATSAPLYAASGNESYLGLGSDETRAIVWLSDDTEPDRVRCTGTFIAPDWLVTAAHCLGSDPLSVHVLGDEGAPASVLPVTTAIAHAELDVALVQVERAPAISEQGSPTPLGVLADRARGLAPGARLELAGYGLTEAGTSDGLEFLTEPIVELDDESITVSGFGATGACSGDSGGPLLLRDQSGAVVVAGVLSLGSVSCRDRDTYARLDAVADFIAAVVGPLPPPQTECGAIDQSGSCLYGSALFCANGALVATTCAEQQHCGWDDGASGWRCVPGAPDPCPR